MSNAFSPAPHVSGVALPVGQSPIVQQFLQGGAQLISTQEHVSRCTALCAMSACVTNAAACAAANCNVAFGVC